MQRAWTKLGRNDSGAVAPIIGLSLVGLIAAGGIAFDYSRMASLDTELQDAADQAALAAASQLDGSTDACKRAGAAAASLLANNTLFSNDGGARKIAVPSETACDGVGNVRFYQSYTQSTDTPGAVATTDATARVVVVQVTGRTANFALTPIVKVFDSGTLNAEAAASISSAICKVPPLMVCAPSGGGDFPTAADIGKGVQLQPGPKNGAWAPGDYGYLDFGNGASGLAINLGKNQEAAGCLDNDSGIDTEPGNKASVTSALNTRFDLYDGPKSSDCVTSSGDYCPAENTRKDLVRTETVVVTQTAQPARPACGDSRASVTDFTQGTDTKGFTRDSCHISGTCSGSKFGDGNWDRASYLAATNPTATVAAVATAMGKTATTLTRWDVYKWELTDKANRMKAILTNTSDTPVRNNGKNTWTFTNKCAYPYPVNGTAVPASGTQKDRRVLTIASVDCAGLNGKGTIKIKRFLDAFLVEPSLGRSSPYSTGGSEIYGEIIGVATKPNGQSAYQYYLRQRPRLLK